MSLLDAILGNANFMNNQCLICQNPLGDIEITLNHKWHYDCEKCQICGNDLAGEVIAECLTSEREISHKPCWDKKHEALMAARPVEVTQGLLDYLNNVRLMIDGDLSKTIDDNQSIAEQAQRRWMHDKSIDEIFMSLRKMQAITACCSIVLNERQKKEVSLRISTEEKRRREAELKSQVLSAEDFRESEQKKLERKREKQTPEGKAIAQLMKTFGWNEEVAREHLKSMKANSQGTESVQ